MGNTNEDTQYATDDSTTADVTDSVVALDRKYDERKQQVIDEFAKRGFTVFSPDDVEGIVRSNMGAAGGLMVALSESLGVNLQEMARALRSDNLPCGFSMTVHTTSGDNLNDSIPSELHHVGRDESVTMALFVAKDMQPLTFEVATAAIALKFIDTLIGTQGNVTEAIEATKVVGKQWEDELQKRAAEPRNEQERLVIEEFAKYGYVPNVLGNGVRCFMLEFDGGWHAITVLNGVNETGELPQTMGEPVSAALHMHALRRNFAVDVANSRLALDAAANAIKLYESLKTEGRELSHEELADRVALIEQTIENELAGDSVPVNMS